MDPPEDNHVIRFVPPSRLLRDEDGNVIGLLAQAFKMRPDDHGALSVSWVQYFKNNNLKKDIEDTVNHFRSRRTVNKNSVYAVGIVGEIKSVCRQVPSVRKVNIVHAPTKNNKPHSKIIHLPENDSLVMETLADKGFPLHVVDRSIP